jgi:hypothetical protein
MFVSKQTPFHRSLPSQWREMTVHISQHCDSGFVAGFPHFNKSYCFTAFDPLGYTLVTLPFCLHNVLCFF